MLGVDLSIVVPVYNVEQYIEKCIDSILGQTFKNFELILVDDGSIDKSGIICNKYAKVDQRIKVIHQDNMGVSVARNIGLENVEGSYIGWVDPDDWISPKMFDVMMSEIIITKSDIVICDWFNVCNDHAEKYRMYEDSFSGNNDTFMKHLADSTMNSHLWNKVFKKSLFEEIEFPHNINMMEDYAVMHLLFHKAKMICYLNDALYYYVMRKNSATYNIEIRTAYNAFEIAINRAKFISQHYPHYNESNYFAIATRAGEVCHCYAIKSVSYDLYRNARRYLRSNIFNICSQGNFGLKGKIGIILHCIHKDLYLFFRKFYNVFKF